MDAFEARKFDVPVRLTLNGREREVLKVADAGRLLLNDWPINTMRRRRAMLAILAALRDKRPIEDARQAFVDAAQECTIVQAA